jgi:hypothetical protein
MIQPSLRDWHIFLDRLPSDESLSLFSDVPPGQFESVQTSEHTLKILGFSGVESLTVTSRSFLFGLILGRGIRKFEKGG